MAAGGSLMANPAVFHSSIRNASSLPGQGA
jgi:hypothetical protein